MASDYGDEAGGKLLDWMLRIGQEAGAEAMARSARELSERLACIRGTIAGGRAEAIAASGANPIIDPESAMAAIPAALRAGRVFSTEALPLCAGTACACAALLAWARSMGSKGARRDGEEHGSSRWATPKDIPTTTSSSPTTRASAS